jgi:hypothetical protein
MIPATEGQDVKNKCGKRQLAAAPADRPGWTNGCPQERLRTGTLQDAIAWTGACQ